MTMPRRCPTEPTQQPLLDRPTKIVLTVVAYLMFCVFGALLMLGKRAQGGGPPLTPGQFAYLFLLVCPCIGGGWMLLQSALEDVGSLTGRTVLWLVAAGLSLLALGGLGWYMWLP